MNVKCIILSAAAAAALFGQSTAAVIHLAPIVAEILNPDFSPVNAADIVSQDPATGAVLRPRAEKYVVRVDVMMTIDDLQPQQMGFADATFHINWDGVALNDLITGWIADTSTVPPHGSMLWADNLDGGVVWGDLQDIEFGIFQRGGFDPDDPRRRLGQDEPQAAGFVFFDLPGARGSSGAIELLGAAGSVFDPQFELSGENVTVEGGSLRFEVVPEPASFVLACFTAALCGWRARTDVVARRPREGRT